MGKNSVKMVGRSLIERKNIEWNNIERKISKKCESREKYRKRNIKKEKCRIGKTSKKNIDHLICEE
jgi:hypothetical protein